MPENSFDYRNFTDKLTAAGRKDFYDCPACGGNNFQIDSKTGKAQCWSGCELKVIRDLIAPLPTKQPAPKSVEPQTWDYFDREGNAAIRVNRLDDGDGGKKIWQSYWHLGRWQKAGDVPDEAKAKLKASVLPYRYAEAIQYDQVFWVEGEKCADALWSLGIPAVTSIGGCDGLNRYGDYSGLFEGKELVICPDLDQSGIKYAEGIAKLYPEAKWLRAFPTDPRWKNPPIKDGVDIADWIAQGATKDQILNAIESEVRTVEETSTQVEKPLIGRIQELLESSLSTVELEAAKIELRKASGVTEREFERLWQGVTNQSESDEDDLSQSIELLVSAQQSQLNLADILPASLARPLTQLAQWQNLRPEIYLACLLAVTGTQAKNGTKLVLHRAQDFEVTPNAYFAIVAESSQKKSPVLKAIVKKPLRILAQRDKVEHEYQLQEWKRQYTEAKKNGEDFDTPEPVLRLRWYSRATGEAILAQAARVPEQGLLCVSDEIAGYFNSANQYRGGRGSDSEDILEYYDGSGSPVLRVAGVQSDVDAFNFGMAGGIQSKVLQKRMGDCEDSNGNWARWFFVQQPTVASTLPDEQEGFDVTGLLADLYQQISDLPAVQYKLSRAAFKYFQGIYNLLEERRVAEPNGALRAVYGKTAGRIGKLALNLHLIEAVANQQAPTAEISLETIKKAVLIARFAIDQIRAIYAEFGGDDLSPNLAKVIDLSRRLGELRARNVQHTFSNKSCPKPETVRQWFAQLADLGWGVLGGSGSKLTFTAYPDGRRGSSTPTEPEPVEIEPSVEPEPSTETEPESAAPTIIYQVGDQVKLPDGRTGEIVAATETGFSIQNGKPEPERFEAGQIRLAVGTAVLSLARSELGKIVSHYPDGTYRVSGDNWSEPLAASEFEVWRTECSQTEG